MNERILRGAGGHKNLIRHAGTPLAVPVVFSTLLILALKFLDGWPQHRMERCEPVSRR